jgi:hypothetical protein
MIVISVNKGKTQNITNPKNSKWSKPIDIDDHSLESSRGALFDGYHKFLDWNMAYYSKKMQVGQRHSSFVSELLKIYSVSMVTLDEAPASHVNKIVKGHDGNTICLVCRNISVWWSV